MILKNQALTFSEWMQEISRPKRQYFMDITGDNKWLRIAESEFHRNERAYVGTRQRSRCFIVECPESGCRILIQSNGGIRGNPLDQSWRKKKLKQQSRKV